MYEKLKQKKELGEAFKASQDEVVLTCLHRLNHATYINIQDIKELADIPCDDKKSFEYHIAFPTDEGYSFEHFELRVYDTYAEIMIVEGGRDCDGQTSQTFEYQADLKDGRFSEWKEASKSCYDQYAEMAGY